MEYLRKGIMNMDISDKKRENEDPKDARALPGSTANSAIVIGDEEEDEARQGGDFVEGDGDEDDSLSNFDEEDEDEVSWISWFCSLRGNELFVEVEEEYIQDDFNLCGLSSQVPFYEYALDTILDLETPGDEDLTEEQHQMVESAAEQLYGLIHARFILTTRGLQLMEEKFKSIEFGRCPRVHCQGQPVLPVGLSDLPKENTVKIFCPKCEEIYYPRSSRHRGIDGAYWGTTFPHLFLMSYSDHIPQKSSQTYVPRIYGFRVNKAARQPPVVQQSSAAAGSNGSAAAGSSSKAGSKKQEN